MKKRLTGLVALLFVASMVFQADASYVYSLDDGAPNSTLGAGAAGTVAWGNMYPVNAVGGAYLQTIELVYGYNVAGLPVTWRVFNDDDGVPTAGLVELASGTYTVTVDGPNNVNVIPTGTVDVTGDDFLFIAAELTYTVSNLKPLIVDSNSPQGGSWVGFVPTGGTFTWADGGLVDTEIYPLNWIVRGNADAVPEPSTLVLMTLLGGVAMLWRRR